MRTCVPCSSPTGTGALGLPIEGDAESSEKLTGSDLF